MDEKVAVMMVGTILGATLKGIWDYVVRAQDVSIAARKAYYERVLRERIDEAIVPCRAWAIECAQLLHSNRCHQYVSTADSIRSVRTGAMKLDAVYGREWDEKVVLAHEAFTQMAKGKGADASQRADAAWVEQWVKELEYYGVRQMRWPGAGVIRLWLWRVLAHCLYDRSTTPCEPPDAGQNGCEGGD